MSEENKANTAFADQITGMVQRISMKIIGLPKEQRDEQLKVARKHFKELGETLKVPADKVDKWADLCVEMVRSTVTAIEMGGGAKGGTA